MEEILLYINFFVLIIPISFYLIICKYNGIKLLNMFSNHTMENFFNENNKLAITSIFIMELSIILTILILSLEGNLAIKNLRNIYM
ncbi:hypothetical protein FDA52_04835 [Clostridium botulinum]|nr:hypothetical protein [Clostridium botulinum]NFI52296.1 hypothetical protein [Clostridium botulinum]